MRVLVVEDTQEMLRLYEHMLKRHGHTAIAPKFDGPLSECLPVDVAIIDYTLPEQSGVEVLADLRKVQPDLPAIFASAVTGQQHLNDIKHTGCPLLRKPFSWVELNELLLEVTSGQT